MNVLLTKASQVAINGVEDTTKGHGCREAWANWGTLLQKYIPPLLTKLDFMLYEYGHSILNIANSFS